MKYEIRIQVDTGDDFASQTRFEIFFDKVTELLSKTMHEFALGKIGSLIKSYRIDWRKL